MFYFYCFHFGLIFLSFPFFFMTMSLIFPLWAAEIEEQKEVSGLHKTQRNNIEFCSSDSNQTHAGEAADCEVPSVGSSLILFLFTPLLAVKSPLFGSCFTKSLKQQKYIFYLPITNPCCLQESHFLAEMLTLLKQQNNNTFLAADSENIVQIHKMVN